jgi:urocanate hydratase
MKNNMVWWFVGVSFQHGSSLDDGADIHQDGFSLNHSVNLQDGVGVVGLKHGSIGGVGHTGPKHVISLKDNVGDVSLHCIATPSKSKIIYQNLVILNWQP